MDGDIRTLELARTERIFSTAEVQKVRQLKRQGRPLSEIAKAVGLSVSSLQWYFRKKAFGVLPKSPGKRHYRRTTDCEKSEILFGLPKPEWQGRIRDVQKGWDYEEEQRRQLGIMPNNETPFGLKGRKRRNNQHTKNGNDNGFTNHF